MEKSASPQRPALIKNGAVLEEGFVKTHHRHSVPVQTVGDSVPVLTA